MGHDFGVILKNSLPKPADKDFSSKTFSKFYSFIFYI